MDLTLTRRGDYAVRAAISLARHYGANGYRKIREVAQEMGLPPGYTAQILSLLSRAELAEAKAGRDGGYRLLRRPEEISLLEVVEAAEGPLQPQRCTLRGGPCRWEDACPVHWAWAEAGEALRRSLAAASLASVAREDEALERGDGAAARAPAHAERTPRRRG
ncbi:MAG: Rrf2 family transcriptional regulator [Dehalococcoidia bacterium]